MPFLRSSDARFKFVFIHQLVSGEGKGGRGGAEAAPLYEWGGHDEVGEWRFGEFRPGWEQPVHALLRETGVSAVFHGHDHFFAPNSGHVRVDVSKEKAVISYVRSANEDLKRPRFENGDVAYEYLIVPASSPAPGSTTR